MFTTSPAGIALIKQFEGLRLDSYRDSVGVWTVGWGTTHGAEPDQHITEEQADAMLQTELQHVEGVLNAAITYQELKQNQFDACASFTYNVGAGNFTKSTLHKKLNAGDIAGAAQEFPKWDHAGNAVLQGLLNRRLAEQEMFLG